MSPVPAIQTQRNAVAGGVLLEQAASVPLSNPLKMAIPSSKSGKGASSLEQVANPQSKVNEALKKKVWIRYSVTELLALSKSPLCQPPCPLPILDAKKINVRGGKHQNQNFPSGTQSSVNDSVSGTSGSIKAATGANSPAPSPRRISLHTSQLNFQGAQKQRTQGMGSSKSSSVFQFKGRKSEEEISGLKFAASETPKQRAGDTVNSRPPLSQESRRSQNTANGKRSGGNNSQVPEWMDQDALPDPIQQANQQQNFANWKEQQKLKDAARQAPAKEVPAPSPPATDGSRFKKYFNKPATTQESTNTLETSFKSLDIMSENPPIVEGQNLDFILKALQQDTPIRQNEPTYPSDGMDPAIVALEGSSLFFNPHQNHPPEPFNPSLNQRGEFTPFSFPYQNEPKPPTMNVPSGDIPTAVLKKLSAKAPTVHLGETNINLTSFLESRNRQTRANAFPPSHAYMNPSNFSLNSSPHSFSENFPAHPSYHSSQSISLDDLFASQRNAPVPPHPSYIDPKFASWNSAPTNPPFFPGAYPYDYNQRHQ